MALLYTPKLQQQFNCTVRNVKIKEYLPENKGMVYNFVNKEPTFIVITSGEFVAEGFIKCFRR